LLAVCGLVNGGDAMTNSCGKWFQLLMISALLLGQPLPAWSQSGSRDIKKVDISSQVDNGLNRITFATAKGNVIAMLPAEIAPADTIWGSITLAPAGRTAEDRKDNFSQLKKMMVQLKPEHGSAVMMAPGCSPKALYVPADCSEIQASLYDPDDKSLHTYRLNCLSNPPENQIGDGMVAMPQVAVPKRFFRCDTNTNGSPLNAACAINNQNCPSVAGGPRGQWFAAPQDLPARPLPIKFYLPDKQQVAESQISVVQPKIYADKLLKVGDKGQVKITLEGLKRGTEAQLIFRNLSPDVISVGGGDYQVIPLMNR